VKLYRFSSGVGFLSLTGLGHPFCYFSSSIGSVVSFLCERPRFPSDNNLFLVTTFRTKFRVLHSYHYIHSILQFNLVKKWCTLYLSLFHPSNQNKKKILFSFSKISGWRNLNRGICRTPFFDPIFYFFSHSSVVNFILVFMFDPAYFKLFCFLIKKFGQTVFLKALDEKSSLFYVCNMPIRSF
jgi:hypothetical protein